jgi:PAS domain S-box-containing protein
VSEYAIRHGSRSGSLASDLGLLELSTRYPASPRTSSDLRTSGKGRAPSQYFAAVIPGHACSSTQSKMDGASVQPLARGAAVASRDQEPPDVAGMDSNIHASVLAALSEGVVVVARDGALIQANAAASAILGVDLPSLAAAAPWWKHFAARRASDGSSLDVGRHVLSSGNAIHDVAVELELGGAIKTLMLNYMPLRGITGATEGLVLSFRDVTEDTRRRTDLLAIEDRLREAHDVARLASWEWRPQTDEVFVLEALAEADLRAGAVLSFEQWLELVPAEEQEWVTGDFAEYVSGEREDSVRRFCYALQGGAVWLEIRSRAVRDGDGALLCVRGTAQDVSEQELAREELASKQRVLVRAHDHLLAVTDSMTEGVFTLDGSGCVDYINQAAAELLGWPVEMIKGRPVHPTIHAPGADATTGVDDDSQSLWTRLGDGVLRVDDDLFVRADGGELPVSYTAAPLAGDNGSRGCVVVFADITDRKTRERAVEGDLEKLACVARIEEALTGEGFVLYAQPILDLSTDGVVQHELLIRMRPPGDLSDANLIAPGDFLPAAEEFGLITKIDRWVIDQGTEMAAAGFAVELNVSGRSIDDPRLVDYIEDSIERSGADPELIIFEITETTMIANEAAARGFVESLHRIGCKLALDDFGTGYGGFTYVKQLPIDFLKIDVEFVGDLRHNPASRNVVQAIVNLAEGFGLETVAEGVEDEQTLQAIRKLGVSYAQGYHIGRPAPLTPTTEGDRDA